MPCKKRSGLSNHRRAYDYTKSTPFLCPSIDLADVATFTISSNLTIWQLNPNVTILSCQTLTIPVNSALEIRNFNTLTNNGTVLNNGIIACFGSSTINNNGVISNADGSIYNFNNGAINNAGVISLVVGGIINYRGGVINNLLNGTIYVNGGFLYNYVVSGLEAIINNDGIIYNYNNGRVDSSSIFTNNGTINNANGLSTCGIGIIVGLIPTGSNCP